MENRMLGEYKNSTSFYSTQSGLNTALGGEDEVRRSRIEHLPSYKRRDLSGKLDFIVVFQTLEIERLSTEIEALRVMLRDAERQIRNSLSYQVQIRELTQNCHQLEQQQAEYQHQVEQMSLACNALYGQLADAQKQRERDAEANNSKTVQLNATNQQLTQRASAFEDELRRSKDCEKESQRRAKAIAQEVARLTQSVAESEEKAMKKGKEFARLQQDLKNWQESDRKQRERTVNVLRQQKRQLAQEAAHQRAQAATVSNVKRDLQSSKRENEFLKQEMDNLKDQFFRLRNESKSNLAALNQSQLTNQQLTRQLKLLSSDIAKEKERSQQIGDLTVELKAKIEVKAKDLEAVKRNVMSYEREMQSRKEREAEITKKVEAVDSILAQNNSLQDQIMKLNNKLIEMQGEKNIKAQQLIDLALDNKELQSRIRQLQVACQRNESELQSLEVKLQKNRQEMEDEKRRLANEYQSLLQKEGEEKTKLCNQVKQLEKDLQIVKQEGLVKQELRSQIKLLAENIKRQEASIQSMIVRLQTYQGIFKKMKEKYAQMNEVAKANTILRQQLDASFALNDRMIKKIGIYEQEIEALTDQNWRLTDKIREEYFKDDFSTASSTKTATSLRYSNIQQVKPFDTLPERSFVAQQGRSFIEGILTKETQGSSLALENSFGTLSSGWRR